MPFFSIIVPTCNRPKDLLRCLQSVVSQHSFMLGEGEGKTYEVVVSDDGSDTQGLLHQITDVLPQWDNVYCRLLKGPRRGPAANRNYGAQNAKGRWLVFVDDDCVPAKDWLLSYWEAIHAHSALAFEGAIYKMDTDDFDLSNCPANEAGGNFWSANVAVSRDFFFDCGGFDANFRYAFLEDKEFYNRIKLKIEVPFIKESAVYHPVKRDSFRRAIWRDHIGAEALGYLLSKGNSFFTQVSMSALREKMANLSNDETRAYQLIFLMKLIISAVKIWAKKYKEAARWWVRAMLRLHFKKSLVVTIHGVFQVPRILYYYFKYALKNNF
jgi:glycosyltransferase involved in cell wall biosynthesis